jgi:hypothetical protein
MGLRRRIKVGPMITRRHRHHRIKVGPMITHRHRHHRIKVGPMITHRHRRIGTGVTIEITTATGMANHITTCTRHQELL